ncbi:MAG: immunoglobulin domain-containing protein [Verrucomicrobia bacterium]|nr:immunoglobulin domain-containing protein [Verrucomicrobiota bacterium]
MRFPRLTSLAAACLCFVAALPAMDHTRPPDTRALAATAGALAPGDFVPDFRLTDHTGTTRNLSYESTAKAVVLVFTDTGHPRALQTAAALRALRSRFPANQVTIWQIDSNLAASRAVLAAEQTLFANDTPVLLDDAQIVAAELGATRQLETIVVSVTAPAFFTVAYRGPLDNALSTSLDAPTINYAADAVAAVLAGRTPSPATVPLPATARELALPPATTPDYATDVAPVVLRRCVSCHSPGNIAPHVYAKFDDLASRALQIRADLLVKRMSPWHADAQFGVFANSSVLTPAEASTLYTWARAGAPRGSATTADPLAIAAPPPGGDWPLGPPDLVLTIPNQTLPATGVIDYRYITLAAPTTTDKWLKATVVRPGNARVVHHALVFDGSLLDVLLASGGLGGFFAGYVPGLQQDYYPESTGKFLRAGGLVTFQMHYTPTGRPETDQTQIGFYFHASPPERELQTKAANNVLFSIPPGARDHAVSATFTPSATKDVLLYELNPHMHLRGKRMKFDANYADGTSETLVNVPQYDFAWQSNYRLVAPKRLPAGTSITVSGGFDNSAQNPANPNPGATVRFGEQTSEEMFIGYINYAELNDRAPSRAPVFASRLTAQARVGTAFSLRLAATNSPAAYRADLLPAGLTLDATTGVISGTPTSAGRRAITIFADNTAGSAATTLDLVVAAAASAPAFTTQPQSARARLGGSATLTAAVTGASPLTYTWYFRGGEFCNTDAPVLTLNDITAAYAGDYYCVASNTAGSAQSATASLSLEFSGLVNLSARANVGTGANVVIPGFTVAGTKPKTLLVRAAGPALAALGVGGTLANPVLSIANAAGEKIVGNDNWGDVPDALGLKAAFAAHGAFALPDGSRDAAALVTLPPGSYTVQVAGSGTGAAATGVSLVEVYEADASPSTLVNLSCRAQVGTGANVLIAGFNLSGPRPRRVLIRGIGPALAGFGLTGTLANPKLDLFDAANATVASNDDWGSPAAGAASATALKTAFASVGAFALADNSRDAALIVTLPPGSYTAQVSGLPAGAGVSNTTGLAMVEVYDLP